MSQQYTQTPESAAASSQAGDPPERHTFESSRVLGALLGISNFVGSNLGLDKILDEIVQLAARTMGVRTATIYIWNEDETRLIMRANIGFPSELIGKAGFDRGQGIPGQVAVTGEILALADATIDSRYEPLEETLKHNWHAYICAPLKIQNEIIGVMTARKSENEGFTPDEITIFETVCKQVAIVIEKERMKTAKIEAERLAAVAVSLSGVAHYIKNLLHVSRGAEYVIDAGMKRENLGQVRKGWSILRRQSRKINSLVENMLSYYREQELNPRPLDFNRLILDTMQELDDRAVQNKVDLIPDLDLRVDTAEVDHDAFEDILINLIDNAIDATAGLDDARVIVKTRLVPESDELMIVVSDNGSGIGESDRDKVFNLFYSTKGHQGTGIGLATTRKLIVEHGGSIEFETEEPGGTDFIIRIPLIGRLRG